MNNELIQEGWNAVNVNGELHVEDDVIIGGILYARKIKSPYKGLFASFEQLKRIIPSPEVGDYADVGYESPSSRYVCEVEGVWKDSGQPGIDPSVVIADYLNPFLISRIGFTDSPVKIDDGEYLLSWNSCNIYYGKCESAHVDEGSVNIAPSLGPEHNIGYIVFDNNSGTFNYYSEDTIPENRDELLLIAIFKNKARELVFSTSTILDDVEDPITPIDLLRKELGQKSDEAQKNGTIYSRIKALEEYNGIYNYDLIEALEPGSSVEESLTVDGKYRLPYPGDVIQSDTSKGIVLSSSVFSTKISFSYQLGIVVTTVNFNSQTKLVTSIEKVDIETFFKENVTDREGKANGFAMLDNEQKVALKNMPFIFCTEEEYDNLEDKDPNQLYLIYEE